MLIPHDNFVPLTPASSRGSSATILPSHSAWSKNGEPERGRSLSRSSSSSGTSSSAILLLSPRSSVDSATPTPIPEYFPYISPSTNDNRRGDYSDAQNHYYSNLPGLSQYPPIDISATAQYRGPSVYWAPLSTPRAPSAGSATVERGHQHSIEEDRFLAQLRQMRGEQFSVPPIPVQVPEPPVPSNAAPSNPFDYWGQWRPAPPIPTDVGLFGPRSPRDIEPELLSTAPASPRTPLSRVTELSEPESAQPVPPPVAHPLSRHIAPIIVPAVTPPPAIAANDAPKPSTDRYHPQRSTPIVVYSPGTSRSRSRSRSTTPTSPGQITRPVSTETINTPPIIVSARNSTRSRSRSPRGRIPSALRGGLAQHDTFDLGPQVHSRGSSRSGIPPPPIIVPAYYPATPVIIQASPQSPIIMSRRSRSRSPFESQAPYRRGSRSRSPAQSFNMHPHIIVHSRRSRSRSRSRSPRTYVSRPPIIRSRSPRYVAPRHCSPIVISADAPRRRSSRSRSRSPIYVGSRHYPAHSPRRSHSPSFIEPHVYRGRVAVSPSVMSRAFSRSDIGAQTPRPTNNPPAFALTDFLRSSGLIPAATAARVGTSTAAHLDRTSDRSRSLSPDLRRSTRRARRQRSPSTSISSESSNAPPVVVTSGVTPPPTIPPPSWYEMGEANPPLSMPPPAMPPSWSAPGQGYYPGCGPLPPRQGGWGPLPPPPPPCDPWITAAQGHVYSPYGTPSTSWDWPYPPAPAGPTSFNMWGRPVHPRFWHADGDFMVQVENTDYKLHRHLFNRAKNFAPLMWGIQSNPYRLTETKVDFDRLLSILYPADYSEQELKTADEWSSVLLLADKWQIPDIRRLAIKELAACAGPVDKIALGHRYDIPEWLGPAYLALAMRKEPVTSAEGTKMGIAAMVRIAAIKDEVLANLTEYVDLEKFCDLFSKVVL